MKREYRVRKKPLKIAIIIALLLLIAGLVVNCVDGHINGFISDTGNDITYEIDENGEYSDCDNVALYIHVYKHLPSNYVTKDEAYDMGWRGGNPNKKCDGKSIGGDIFENREGLLPKGESYYECDVDYPQNGRGTHRLIFTKKGIVYFTEDHYNSFTLLYEED